MQHVTFALFRKPWEARDALRALRHTFAPEDVSVHIGTSNTPASDLEMNETHARRGASGGAMYGGASGLFAAFVISLGGIHWFHLDGATVLFALAAGFLIGGLSGFLFGSINPDPSLRRLRAMGRTGGVIITVEAHSEQSTQRAAEILREHHGFLRSADTTAVA